MSQMSDKEMIGETSLMTELLHFTARLWGCHICLSIAEKAPLAGVLSTSRHDPIWNDTN